MSAVDELRKGVILAILTLESRGEHLGEDYISREDQLLVSKACELFGSWRVALEYAGICIQHNRSHNLVPNKIIQLIRSRVGRLNSVKASRVRQANFKLYRASIVAFGSWNSALDVAGVDRSKLYYGRLGLQPNEDEIIELLRKRQGDGKSMRFVDFACENMAIARTIAARYGNWKSALTKAGLGDVKMTSRRTIEKPKPNNLGD